MLALLAKVYMGCVLTDIRQLDLSLGTRLKANQRLNKAQVEQVKTRFRSDLSACFTLDRKLSFALCQIFLFLY